LRIGAAYVAADLAGGALRVAAGRHRPDSTGDPWRFRPLHPAGDWGSLPSAHVTHAFAIAAGIAEESGRPWAAGLAYGVASLVAAQRVYRQAHWASDVVIGAALSMSVSRGVVRLFDP
jgi:membrane-associated phospholipid phosphatase